MPPLWPAERSGLASILGGGNIGPIGRSWLTQGFTNHNEVPDESHHRVAEGRVPPVQRAGRGGHRPGERGRAGGVRRGGRQLHRRHLLASGGEPPVAVHGLPHDRWRETMAQARRGIRAPRRHPRGAPESVGAGVGDAAGDAGRAERRGSRAGGDDSRTAAACVGGAPPLAGARELSRRADRPPRTRPTGQRLALPQHSAGAIGAIQRRPTLEKPAAQLEVVRGRADARRGR